MYAQTDGQPENYASSPVYWTGAGTKPIKKTTNLTCIASEINCLIYFHMLYHYPKDISSE